MGFVESNYKRIQIIFEENSEYFYETTLLSQPEVFVIWYCIVHHRFIIKDKWENIFPIAELEAQAVWYKVQHQRNGFIR